MTKFCAFGKGIKAVDKKEKKRIKATKLKELKWIR